ncbi:MAG: hypothetical protein QOC79_804 [Actinomycetota bacterium]|nr:hypothetical protein [Actinomycetota bacterium]
MSKFSNRTAALGIMSALALGTIAAAPAFAQGGGTRVTARAQCSAGSQSKLTLAHDNGFIETEFEVDSNRAGQVWNVAIKDNGISVFSGTRTTTAPSGSFTVRRRIPNRAGVDSVVASAKNTRSGETCVVRSSI